MILGERIILRAYREGFTDEELRLQFTWSRDPEITRWSNNSPTSLSYSEFTQQIRYQATHQVDRELFAILTAADRRLIGRIGYFNMSRDGSEAEMGIVIGEKECWGQGYGRDAVLAFLGHVFNSPILQKVYLFTLKENERARRAFAASGFREVGSSKRFSFEFGDYEDIRMEITRREWVDQRKAQGTKPIAGKRKP